MLKLNFLLKIIKLFYINLKIPKTSTPLIIAAEAIILPTKKYF